jgi:L,D-peptidoglycan transpeptidase YkuD (ErfK/YbiS/YcfS/YnhG family)
LELARSGVDRNRPAVQAKGIVMENVGRPRLSRNLPRRILVATAAAGRSRGFLVAGGVGAPCALGRAGIGGRKREGDGKTPLGDCRPVAVLYRPDRLRRPKTALPVTPIRPDMGWCDDPADRNYNRQVALPFAASHEKLWREDHVYDVVVVLDYNLARPVRGAGSAIFLHLARPGFPPTEGCVAVTLAVMRRLLAGAGPETVITIR